MELSRRTIQRMILRQGSVVTSFNQGGDGGGGGSTPTLGELLTSLNSQPMPTSDGYLHWTGTDWEWDDLSAYATQSWVTSSLLPYATQSWVSNNYLPASSISDYLPLAAGSSYPLTGSLYLSGNSGIVFSDGSRLQKNGEIITNSVDITHVKNGNTYTVWDSANTPNPALIGAAQGSATIANFDPQTDTVHITAQVLGSSAQAQARENISAVGSSDVKQIVKMTQAAYDLITPDSHTLYIITSS